MGKAVEVVKHSVARTFSVLCVLLVIAGLGYAVYFAFIKPNIRPNPTQTNNAQVININYYYPNKKAFGIGLNLWGMDFGVSKYVYPTKPTSTETLVREQDKK